GPESRGSRLHLRDRPHPRRAGDGTPVVRRRQNDAQAEHVPGLHRRGRGDRAPQVHGPRPPGGERRERGGPAHGRRGEHAARAVPRRGRRRAVRRRDQHHARRIAPAYGPGMGPVGQPSHRRAVRLHAAILTVRQRGGQGVSLDARHDVLQRFPGDVLGAVEMGREAARPQDRLESALLQGEPGRRPRGLVRAVRSAPGDRVPLRVHARRRRTHRGPPGERQPMIPLPTLLLVLAADSGVAVIPRPAHVAPGSGAFVVTGATVIVTDRATRPLGDLLSDYLYPATGLRLAVRTTAPAGARVIALRLDPALTSLGAEGYRLDVTPGRVAIRAPQPDGGFYTQDDIAELVAYAQARFVTIVPEIEMPGHSQAAIAAYPELGNKPDTLPVWTAWGVDENIVNPGDATIRFEQNVLTEVMALFPGRWIHVGGDEAPKTQWKASPLAQARIRELGLKDEDELQSYFTRRMDEFLTAHGRSLVGWDEILEGGLAPNAVVMSWRGIDGGIAAARAGHDVVMAPGSHTYFDHYQSTDTTTEPLALGGFLPLDTVYAYDPVPAALTPDEARHVLGAQGQLW